MASLYTSSSTPLTHPGRGKKYYSDIKFHDVRKSLSSLGYTLSRNPKQTTNLSFLWRNYRNIPFRTIEDQKKSMKTMSTTGTDKATATTTSAAGIPTTPILNHLEHSYLLTRKASLSQRLSQLVQKLRTSTEKSSRDQATWLENRVPTTFVLRAERQSVEETSFTPNPDDLGLIKQAFIQNALLCLTRRYQSMQAQQEDKDKAQQPSDSTVDNTGTDDTSTFTNTSKSQDEIDALMNIVHQAQQEDDDDDHKKKDVFLEMIRDNTINDLLPFRMMMKEFIADSNDNVWIVKPSTSSRGRGITVIGTYDDLLDTIQSFCMIDEMKQSTSNNNRKKMMKKLSLNIVVQKYIENPLLLPMHQISSKDPNEESKNLSFCKFDIRVWVFVQQNHHVSEKEMNSKKWIVNIFEKPYFRLCGTKYSYNYSKCNLLNKFIHLTNNSVQNKQTQFNQDHLMWTTKQFQHFLKTRTNNNIGGKKSKNEKNENEKNVVWEKVFGEMCELVRLSVMGVEKEMVCVSTEQDFELFGYDFMIDDLFNVHLVEINLDPDLSHSTKVTKEIVPLCVESLLKRVHWKDGQKDEGNRGKDVKGERKGESEENGVLDEVSLWKTMLV